MNMYSKVQKIIHVNTCYTKTQIAYVQEWTFIQKLINMLIMLIHVHN